MYKLRFQTLKTTLSFKRSYLKYKEDSDLLLIQVILLRIFNKLRGNIFHLFNCYLYLVDLKEQYLYLIK